MSLTFGICWIEDQASDAEVEAVETAVRQCGFEPEIHRIETEDQIKEFSALQKHYHDYDLILLDLRLGNGMKGNDLAPQIRGHFRSTPILFYSGEAEDKLRKLMCDLLVEGVYCIHRDRLAARVTELVDALTPALNRLSSMRGLAARVVAECDQEFRSILGHLAKPDGKEGEIFESMKNRIFEGAEKIVGDTKEIKGLGDLLGGTVSSHVLFAESRDRIREANGSDEVRDILRSLRNYPQQVLFRRNALAHALEERTPDGWKIHRRNAKPLTVADFERYRREFLDILQNLRKLRTHLIPQKADDN